MFPLLLNTLSDFRALISIYQDYFIKLANRKKESVTVNSNTCKWVYKIVIL